MLIAHNSVTAEEFRGAPHTVAKIKAAVESGTPAQRYLVRLLAEELIQKLQSKDFLSEALACYYFALSVPRYANDPRTIELVKAPWVVAKEIAAGKTPSLDCDDVVALLVALLLMLGREVQIMTVAFKDQFYNGERQYSHVLVRFREPRSGQWIVFDPVAAEDAAQMLNRVVAVKIWPVA